MSGKKGSRFGARSWYLLAVLTLISGIALNSGGAFAGRLTDQSNPAQATAHRSDSAPASAPNPAPKVARPQSDSLVISQVYGGGGNSGATYRSDFVELFNPTSSAVSLSGWSVQYAPAAGNFITNTTNLTGTIQAYGYYLVKEADGANITTTVPLPQPDFTGTI